MGRFIPGNQISICTVLLRSWELVSLMWLGVQELPNDAPVVVLLPGLAGGSGCLYVQYCAKRAFASGMRPIVFNSRGTAGCPLTAPQFYSASYTGDMRYGYSFVSPKS